MVEYYFLPRTHAFRYGRQKKNPALTRIELTTSALVGVHVTYYTTRATRGVVLTTGSVGFKMQRRLFRYFNMFAIKS